MQYQEALQYSNNGLDFVKFENHRLYDDSNNTQISNETQLSNSNIPPTSISNFSHIFKSKATMTDKIVGHKRNTELMISGDVINSAEPPNKRIDVLQTIELKRSISFTDSMQPNTDIQPMLNPAYHSDKLYNNRLHTDFEVINTLGSGIFGKVFQVTSKIDKNPYAIKVSRSSFRGANERKCMMNEVSTYTFGLVSMVFRLTDTII